MISLIDPEERSMRQELKWLSFEGCLQDDDMMQMMNHYGEAFIADASTFAAS